VDGRDLTQEPFPARRKTLEQIIKPNDRIKPAIQKLVKNPKELENFFEEAIEEGCEGVMCKSTSKDSVYQAGNRGWLWIKFKRDYRSEMTDTVTWSWWALFMAEANEWVHMGVTLATYDPDSDTFETVTKCGTGFTDKDLATLHEMLQKHVVPLRTAAFNLCWRRMCGLSRP